MLFSAILSKMQTIITLLRVPGNVGDKDHNDLPVLHHPSLVLRKVLLVNDHPSTNMSIHTKSTCICRISYQHKIDLSLIKIFHETM